MNTGLSAYLSTRSISFFLSFVLLSAWTTVQAADDECVDSDGYGFVCGPQNAEDLVLIPDTSWIISSSMVTDENAIYLIDASNKTWSGLYSTTESKVEQDMVNYGACVGAPNADNFNTHGLNLRRGDNGRLTLYVVGHGEREAIEVFEVDTGGSMPSLTWIGCAMMPEGTEANSVASFNDGRILTTVLVHEGMTFNDLMAHKNTGAVYEWSLGDDEFTLIAGTELPGNNGIEVSENEEEFFVVSSGFNTIVAFSNTRPARQLRSTVELAITPDNIHLGRNGELITAGLLNDDPVCGNMNEFEEFNIAIVMACPRPYIANAIDPVTMDVSVIDQGPADDSFSNATMALIVDGEIWIGTFAGDRLAYRALP